MAASKVLGGSGGLGLLMSGLPALIVAFAILYSIAWVIATKFYDAVENVLDNIGRSFRQCYQLAKKIPKTSEAEDLLIPLEEQPPLPSARRQHVADCNPAFEALSTPTAIAISFTTLTVSIVILFLQFVRPTTPPYAHMSGSLPVTLIEAALFQPINSEFCLAHPVERVMFPWERFAEYFGQPESLDWMPQSPTCSRVNGPGPPPWLEHPRCDGPQSSCPPDHPHGHRSRPQPRPPHGHHGPPRDHHSLRGEPQQQPSWLRSDDIRSKIGHDDPPMHHRHGFGPGYEPICDPLKLTNDDADVIHSLTESMNKKKPNIKNVLLLTLESTRKDMFPLKKDSHAYKTILSSYSPSDASEELNLKIQNLTSIATFLSGEPNGFGAADVPLADGSWKHEFKDGMGGINVQGAVTQAAYTLKSLLSSHCGVEPLPVDFTEETKGRIYQSCLPQILDAMSSHGRSDSPKRDDGTHTEDYRTWPWESAIIQSVTDQFDSQDILDEQMGFTKVIAERILSDPSSKHYPPKQPWVNYFGYPETETLDYLRDIL